MLQLLFGLLGGSALLIYGVDLMGEGLERSVGDELQKILTKLTGTLWSSFLVGTVVTALVQSSSAITVMTVGFVNAGIMSLRQAVGIIYGANLGTTITAQLMALSLSDFALPIVALGFIIRSAARKARIKEIGIAVMGLGFMFLGLQTLSNGVAFLEQSEAAQSIFISLVDQPLTAMAVGLVTTMLVQSSSATVGMTIILTQSGLMMLPSAIALILGDNIGTCLTAQIASLRGNLAARRTAWAHTLYNVIGSVIVLALIYPYSSMIALTSTEIGRQVANSHAIFNILSAIVFLPLTVQYIKLIEWLVK